MTPNIPEGHIVISTAEITRLTAENVRLYEQIRSLQQNGTLQEEQLRAYRRLELSQEQLDKLKADLEATTRRVLDSYGLKPTHEILLPRVVNGA